MSRLMLQLVNSTHNTTSKPKDFTRETFWDDGTMNDMIEVITKGEAPDMPAFGGRLSEEEILAIATHIEANFRPRAAPTSR